jgi:hypothetical protein
MATFYRELVTALHLALGSGGDQDRVEAAERLRSPSSQDCSDAGTRQAGFDVHGDLAGILAMPMRRPDTGRMGGFASKVSSGNPPPAKLAVIQGRPGKVHAAEIA